MLKDGHWPLINSFIPIIRLRFVEAKAWLTPSPAEPPLVRLQGNKHGCNHLTSSMPTSRYRRTIVFTAQDFWCNVIWRSTECAGHLSGLQTLLHAFHFTHKVPDFQNRNTWYSKHSCLHSCPYSLSCHGGTKVVSHKFCRTARSSRVYKTGVSISVGSCTVGGSEFHRVGPEMTKLLWPYLILERGTVGSPCVAEQ